MCLSYNYIFVHQTNISVLLRSCFSHHEVQKCFLRFVQLPFLPIFLTVQWPALRPLRYSLKDFHHLYCLIRLGQVFFLEFKVIETCTLNENAANGLQRSIINLSLLVNQIRFGDLFGGIIIALFS